MFFGRQAGFHEHVDQVYSRRGCRDVILFKDEVNLSYELEKYKFWLLIDSVSFSRKLEYETAFDLIVKVYSLKSDNRDLNKKLENKFFGDFIYRAKSGFFLRMFESKTSWPRTKLVYVNLTTCDFVEIKATKSSWLSWRGVDLGNDKYQIEISPTETIAFQL